VPVLVSGALGTAGEDRYVTIAEHVFDAATYRRVLGHVPTSVAVVTAIDGDGNPAGMTVGSFSSVSLDPPLVGFFGDRQSRSMPRILAAGSFAVSILAESQQEHSSAFAARGGDRFAGVSWHLSELGSPHLDGSVAWIDCELESAAEVGDHNAVIGRVTRLEVAGANPRPLIFFRGSLCQLDRRTLPRRGDWQLDHYADW